MQEVVTKCRDNIYGISIMAVQNTWHLRNNKNDRVALSLSFSLSPSLTLSLSTHTHTQIYMYIHVEKFITAVV